MVDLVNGFLVSKIHYAAEVFFGGGAPKYIIKRIQSIQLEVAHTVIGPQSRW